MPTTPVLKVVVTHRAAARAKYGPSGWRHIRHAVTGLLRADAARGITTRFFALDSAADANRVGATKVADATDVPAVKACIDRIYAAWNPAYLVLLGGPELVAHASMANPLWTGDPGDDADQFIPSDLPYACDAAYTPSASAFRGPSRAVGRVPDLIGVTDPDVLITQLADAARSTSLVSQAFTPVFALSTKTWRVSTQLSIGKLAGASGEIRTSPAEGPAWAAADLSPMLHFVNCHGAEFEPRWFGEARAGQQNLPVSMDSALLARLVTPGTVVATECCYGTAHWPPAAAAGRISVAVSYLLQGASGVFGASTIAYGPANTTDYADVLCRLFLEEVLRGASLGRAVLSARQRFIQGQSFLDPTDLKTLAQFELLGDPSVHPITVPAAPPDTVARPTSGVPKVASSTKSRSAAGRREQPPVPAGVLARRAVLAAVGEALDRSATVCHDTARNRPGLTVAQLARLLGRELPPGTRIRSFDSSTAAASMRSSTTPVAHVAFVQPSKDTVKSLVVLRAEPGAEPDVKVVVAR